MTSLRAQNLAFAYTDAVELFRDGSFHLDVGWTGLVGENGAGKSTLLRLLLGELKPSDGSLKLEPDGAPVHFCAQSVEVLTPSIRALADGTSPLAHKLWGQLGLDPGALERWSTLSPGERKRWQIGAALAEEPEVLLLDEPTNHLDAEGRELLLGALKRFRGLGVVVSHDRALLDSLTTHTLRLHHGELKLWPGSYSQAHELWEADAQEHQESYQQVKENARKSEQKLNQLRREREAATLARSTGRRMKNKDDHEARSMGAKQSAEWGEKNVGRKVEKARRQAERASAAVGEFEMEKELGRSIFVDYERSPNPWLFSLEADELKAGETPILGKIHLDLGRDDRVWLRGENGAGKTTLLRALLARPRIPAERILFVPQDLSAEQEDEVLEQVRALSSEVKGRVLSLVAALGVDPDRLLASERPSPGEARKLLIARGLAQHAWAVVLDEPTNHLDLPSIERLEEALRAYPGALLLVTHDEALAKACTKTTWRLAKGTLER
jgi:ATPase subunit of ABC transporter with duplicated ATPase domains